MEIRYLTGPKAGQTDDAPYSQEIQILINAGIIEVIPMPQRGEPGWLEAMRAREAHREARRAATLPPDPNSVQGIQYSVHERQYGSVHVGHAYIKRCSGSETLFFDKLETIPSDCPKNIIESFLELNRCGNPEVLAEKRIQDQYRAEGEAIKQREREGKAIAKLVGYDGALVSKERPL
jgi:hypothetical protein